LRRNEPGWAEARIPLYVRTYTPAQRRVLSVKPGITDPASIAYRHEEEVLSASAEPDVLYRNVVLPHKLFLNLEYINQMSIATDMMLILKTLRSILA